MNTGSQESTNWADAAISYGLDASQRAILFWDVMRKRGNIYLDHRAKGQPPVLVFDYETIIDGRDLERPVNYSLVRIIDRRGGRSDRRQVSDASSDISKERRSSERDRRLIAQRTIGADVEANRPVLIIDPRAGHGPGIGGSKLDSQIGMSLNAGHPVYFLVFTPYPEPGQTLADVWRAQIRFLEEIRRRHPNSPKPAVIGNCQGGWAAALIGAERPDLAGPMAFNGSPLSYWGGVEGINPMRYFGGLLGGTWINSLLSDLGNGLFDGANLVANFENLNPANTLWNKHYNLYAGIDTEEQRFLDFEKWWGGFFLMTTEEIATIVNGLFVGNKLEQGQFELEQDKRIDLSNFKKPIVLFSSFGDNITPPQQAINWVAKVYGSSREIKRKGQVIVLVLHEKIGHLGIFASSSIARKQHKEIIGSFDMLEFLPPGLYEMIIEENPDQSDDHDYKVSFAERHVEDILALDDGLEDEGAFYPVKEFSDFNDRWYRTFVRPWVKMFVTDFSADLMRQIHPLRVQRYLFSDMNPCTWPLKMAAPRIRENRKPVSEDNIFVKMERTFSNNLKTLLDTYRDNRDLGQELLFKMTYANPFMEALFPAPDNGQLDRQDELEDLLNEDEENWRRILHQGGYREAAVRILLAIMTADHELSRKEYETAEQISKCLKQFDDITPVMLREMVKEQARMLQVDRQAAISTLTRLLPKKSDRRDAMKIIEKYLEILNRPLNKAEKTTLKQIEGILRK